MEQDIQREMDKARSKLGPHYLPDPLRLIIELLSQVLKIATMQQWGGISNFIHVQRPRFAETFQILHFAKSGAEGGLIGVDSSDPARKNHQWLSYT